MTNNNSKTTTKIPFKVSARTARLIGRENIASSKGAIIELVKNGYDADSNVSIVYFDNKYSAILEKISTTYFTELLLLGIHEKLILELYEKEGEGEFVLKKQIDEEKRKEYKNSISKYNSLYIIDAGEGMTQEIIRNYWMTIGTDNKATDIFTKSGRVKAGAKGIGRFALDKLGSICEMTTIFNPNNHKSDIDDNGEITKYRGYKWNVNWEDFEGEFKTIDKVSAELFGIYTSSLKEEIQSQLPNLDLSIINSENKFDYGTILKISNLRENWDDYYVEQVYSDLEVLVPPKETGEFGIYLFSSLNPQKYGEVFGSLCDDFDYKIIATADENQNVKIQIFRREYDIELIPDEFFNRNKMKEYPFQKENFLKGYWETEVKFAELLGGFKDIDEDNIFGNIGVFEFSFYYLKRSFNSIDAERFFYRKFMSNTRKDWLSKFGGIKLYRDNFRVRPYGEVKDSAFDWLGLGNRKVASPAGVAKEDGGYRVEPENVAGAVKISRLTNVDFEDKSSREGLQDNKTFQVFKQLLASIINIFEVDRSTIAREMNLYDRERYSAIRDRQLADELTRKILEESRTRNKAQQKNDNQQNGESDDYHKKQDDKDKEILAIELEKKEEEIEKLKDEQKILRGLASSGIVLASFSHDLSKLNNVLSSRTEKLKELIALKINEEDYKNIEKRKNPFAHIERMKEQDQKFQNWLNFSLGATRKDKRKRKQVYLEKYFHGFKNDWNTVLNERGIDLNTDEIENLDLRIFEIDLDSIYNNLLVNSLEAYNLLKEDRKREIIIKAYSNDKEIIIDYYDNATGISKDITKPERIFEPLFTTRRNPFTAEEEGTGLGMWLVKLITEENEGTVKLLFPIIGFGIRIIFPIKYKRQGNG